MTFAAPLILALVFATSFLSGMFGMAGGFILMGGLLYFMPVAQAMLVHGLSQSISNITRIVLWRRYIAPRIFFEFLVGAALCALAFVFVRFVPSRALVLFLLGASAVSAALVPAQWAPKMTQKRVPLLCGFISTALQLTSGVSGPFVDQFFIRSELDRRTVVATKASMQATLHILKVFYFGSITSYALDEQWLVLVAAIPVVTIVGATLAGRILERMSDKQFYWWIQRIVFVVGVYYLAEAVRVGFFAGP